MIYVKRRSPFIKRRSPFQNHLNGLDNFFGTFKVFFMNTNSFLSHVIQTFFRNSAESGHQNVELADLHSNSNFSPINQLAERKDILVINHHWY
mmetsp:Transcript_52299/g.131347  ORF Transcript_52299/g.131347 Transcript_52299/m.131347 type:complete len:93 (-) Transcript_52299:1082-1360(-)